MQKFGEIGNAVAVRVVGSARQIGGGTERVAKMREPPPVGNAVGVAVNVANLAHLEAGDAGVVHHLGEKHLQLGVGDAVCEYEGQRLWVLERRGCIIQSAREPASRS